MKTVIRVIIALPIIPILILFIFISKISNGIAGVIEKTLDEVWDVFNL